MINYLVQSLHFAMWAFEALLDVLFIIDYYIIVPIKCSRMFSSKYCNGITSRRLSIRWTVVDNFIVLVGLYYAMLNLLKTHWSIEQTIYIPTVNFVSSIVSTLIIGVFNQLIFQSTFFPCFCSCISLCICSSGSFLDISP